MIVDVATIANKVKRATGDTSGVMIKDADIWGWIDEAQIEILRVTGDVMYEATVNANTFPWNLPATWLKTKRLTYGGVPLKLTELDALDTLSIKPGEFLDTPWSFYHTSSKLHLYPEPRTTDTTSITIFYAGTAATIVSAAVALGVPVSNHVDVLNYVMQRAYEKIGKDVPARYSHDAFESRLSQRAYDSNQPDDTYPVIRDDYRDW